MINIMNIMTIFRILLYLANSWEVKNRYHCWKIEYK